jgi:hypothetical protein
MKKKTIQDLKLNDSVYIADQNQVLEYTVYLISIKQLKFKHRLRNDVEYEREEGDKTSWRIEVKKYRESPHSDTYYLSKLDALKRLRVLEDKRMEGLFARMEDFNRTIKNLNEETRATDELIIKELKNN